MRREGNTEVYLTTTTSTGYKLAKEKYAGLTIGIGYFPLDFWAFSERAWWGVRPDLCILMEGERWPEHVHQAERLGVPYTLLSLPRIALDIDEPADVVELLRRDTHSPAGALLKRLAIDERLRNQG